jgi:hypothetical protein
VDDETPSANEVTLRSYQAAAELWAANRRTSGAWFEVVAMIDEMTTLLPDGASVLEIGSALGEEADVMSSRGLAVRRSDATPAFVAGLRAQGHDVDTLNVITDDLGGPWDAIFANAVFLHLTRDELARVFEKTFAATSREGLLVFSLKEGDGSAWVSAQLNVPRHFTYWRRDELETFLEASPWALRSLRQVDGDVDQWLFCICAKR